MTCIRHYRPNCHGSDKPRNDRKAAFTLAEVLITLTILGVVAAVSIPSIINHYEQRVTVTKVKKMYSTLTTAYDQYLVENNWVKPTYAGTTAGAQKMYEDLVKPYFQISYNAGTDTTKKRTIMAKGQYKWLNGHELGDYSAGDTYYAVQLKDSSVLWFRGKSTGGVNLPTFRYDVNGKKAPNTLGRDIFIFSITDKGIIPGKSNTYQTPQTLAANCRIVNNSNNNVDNEDEESNSVSGSACAAYIILHGNMNYLK